MSNFQKVKQYLLDLNYEILKEDEAEGLFIISAEDKGVANMVLDCEGDILIIEQRIFNIKTATTAIYQDLLKINRTVVHGAYALADDDGQIVIFRDTLQLANLDLNELEASINSLTLSLAENAQRFIDYSQLN
jgi:hypothetical protein